LKQAGIAGTLCCYIRTLDTQIGIFRHGVWDPGGFVPALLSFYYGKFGILVGGLCRPVGNPC